MYGDVRDFERIINKSRRSISPGRLLFIFRDNIKLPTSNLHRFSLHICFVERRIFAAANIPSF